MSTAHQAAADRRACDCPHPALRAPVHGVERCPQCGAERYDAYDLLRLPLPDSVLDTSWGLPQLGAPGKRVPAPGVDSCYAPAGGVPAHC
ncbi:DUF6255 family natural product biosynthesis protein [Streptomyces gamaensis]|uniref:DUF6255 family natural product biosynthesis protein n=1 Tax=Streptomyces gamaensis TaxID=1763542 RepID=A0ABW0YXT3_9ACTN